MRLLAHLEKVVLGSMTKEGDSLYDVKFADAVRSSSSQSPRPLAQQHKPQSHKPKPHKPPPVQADTQCDDDPVASEPALSGDE